jgi:Ca-activated chloride channel family protein
VACVQDEKEVTPAIEKKTWTRTVLENDYNRLKQEVASDIKAGEQDKALERLESCRKRQAEINAVVGSGEV